MHTAGIDLDYRICPRLANKKKNAHTVDTCELRNYRNNILHYYDMNRTINVDDFCE